MESPFQQFEGPRLVQRAEAIDSMKLFHLCFGGPEIENEQEILDHYVTPKRGGVYALFHEHRPVSQIMIFHDQVRIHDGRIRAGSIGGVCTHPEYRDRGLASVLLNTCARQLRQEGARLMLISGARGVYTRLGNVPHGKFVYFTITPGKEKITSTPPGRITVRRAAPSDASLCSRLYQAEPVHFVRRRREFEIAIAEPMNNPYLHTEAWIVERTGQAIAYLLLGTPYDMNPTTGIRHVSEYAGSHLALAEAIEQIMRESDLQEIYWPVAWQESELTHLLRTHGYEGKVAPLDGHTWRILDFAGFMKDLQPILQARFDPKLLRGLRFEQSGPLLGGSGADRFTILRGSERLDLDGAAMTHLVLGNADRQAGPVQAPGALSELITHLFPLPSFLPGLNYH